VSTPDSFIDEVTDAVRRDRLFATFRKYGWIGVVVILVIVGGAGYSSWSKSRADARAQAFGDALLDAVDLGNDKDRLAAFAAIPADGGQVAIQDLLLASAPAGDKAAALEALDKLANDASVPQVYRDLAVLKKVLIEGSDTPVADRRAALAAIDVAGRPLRVLVEEQLAYLSVEEGKPADAVTALSALYQDQEAPQSLQQRIAEAIVALGGKVPERAAPAAAAVQAEAG
jgi:hypothetical protein